MSIECITGVPGAGKSYKAALIVKNAYESKKRTIYTNINLRVSYDDYLKLLDVDKLFLFAKAEYELFEHFEKLSTAYEDSHKDDDISLKDDIDDVRSDVVDTIPKSILVEDKCKNFNRDDISDYIGNYDKYLHASGLLDDIEGSLIVWDECQNHLQGDGVPPKANPIWIRFFSYHRHFNIDIVLVTQDITLIHRRYKPFIFKFYFGQNPAKRFLTTTLKFKVYTDSREFEKFYIETQNIPMKKEIHNFYDSGEYSPSKSVLLKKVAPPILLLVAGLIFFYFFFDDNKSISNTSSKSVSVNADKNVSTCNSSVSDYKDTPDIDDSNHILFFTCNLKNCVIKNSSFTVPLDSINDFADAVGMEILYSSNVNRYYKLVAVSVPESLYNSLMQFTIQARGDKHEKGRMDFRSHSNKF
jgi:zona occludens toxin